MIRPAGSPGEEIPRLTLDRDCILRTLWTVTAALVAIYLALQVFRLRTGHDTLYGLLQFFDLDQENSLPTFFSICLLLTAAGLLALISRAAKHQGDPLAAAWTWLGLGFFLLGLDEGAGIHEKLSRPLKLLPHVIPLPYAAWVVIAVMIVAAVLVAFLPFLRRLPAGTRRVFLLAGALYVGGAVGMEIPGGEHFEYHGADLIYVLFVAAEEGLEMCGVTLFIGELFSCFAAQGGIAGITVRGRPK